QICYHVNYVAGARELAGFRHELFLDETTIEKDSDPIRHEVSSGHKKPSHHARLSPSSINGVTRGSSSIEAYLATATSFVNHQIFATRQRFSTLYITSSRQRQFRHPSLLIAYHIEAENHSIYKDLTGMVRTWFAL